MTASQVVQERLAAQQPENSHSNRRKFRGTLSPQLQTLVRMCCKNWLLLPRNITDAGAGSMPAEPQRLAHVFDGVTLDSRGLP